MDRYAADLVALFHHQNGFAELGGLDRRPPSRRAATDDDEIEIAQLLVFRKRRKRLSITCRRRIPAGKRVALIKALQLARNTTILSCSSLLYASIGLYDRQYDLRVLAKE
jgi:hypothetical protein